MRKIVSNLFISLDGVVEEPGNWHFPYFNDRMGEVVGGQMQTSGGMLLGRKTYDGFASYWPSSEDDIAEHMNGSRKWVLSTTMDEATWQNTTLITGDDVAGQVRALKDEDGGDVGVVGSATVVRWLLQEGLLDELHLLVHPIVVGAGDQLWQHGFGQHPLELVSSETFDNGVLYLVYAPTAEVPAAG